MNEGLGSLRLIGVALFFGCTLVGCFAIVANPSSAPNRAMRAYVRRVNHELDLLFQPRRGQQVLLGQTIVVAALVVVASGLGAPLLLLGVPLACALPLSLLKRRVAERRKRIAEHLPGFATTLANALKSAPNLVGALSQSQKLSPPGLDQELGLAIREIEVGSSLDQALARMGRRIRSSDFDSIAAGILIGKRVGGNLPQILETLSTTLREIARLEGVMRTRTAEGRTQAAALAVFPGVLILAFGALRPGHFDPLLDRVVGWVVVVAAVTLWVGSAVVARKILSVEV